LSDELGDDASADRGGDHAPGTERDLRAGGGRGGERRGFPPPHGPRAGADFRIPLGFPGSDLAAGVTRLVERAATVLEEELANGIVAAQHVGNRFTKRESLRESSEQQLFFRFRRDAHEIVDMLMDVIGATADRVGGVAARVVRIGGSQGSSPTAIRNGVERLPVLEPEITIAKGETAVIPMTIENDGREPTETFSLVCSSLVGETGEQLGTDAVTFDPPSLTLAPGESASVSITVSVAPDAARGVYSGIVQATKLDNVRAVLIVTID
jgi:hypothetical protein